MNFYQMLNEKNRATWQRSFLRACLAPTIAVAGLFLGGCASSGDPYMESAVSTTLASEPIACPAGYLLVCEIRSPQRISDGRYGFREPRGRKKCSCESETGFEAMKTTPLL